MRKMLMVLNGLCLCVFVSFAEADPIHIRIEMDQDSYVASSAPDTNNANVGYLYLVNANGSWSARTFMQSTNLMSALAGYSAADVTKAEVVLQVKEYGTGVTADVHTVNGTWDESTITWNNMPGTTDSGIDVTTGVQGSYPKFDATDMVKGWLNSPSSNHGLMLLTQYVAGSVKYTKLYCSEDAASVTPLFDVYLDPAPEPCTMILLGIGGLCLLRKKCA